MLHATAVRFCCFYWRLVKRFSCCCAALALSPTPLRKVATRSRISTNTVVPCKDSSFHTCLKFNFFLITLTSTMMKWLRLVPISSHEPVSRTKYGKYRLRAEYLPVYNRSFAVDLLSSFLQISDLL